MLSSFMKRTSTIKDKYANQISFPGCKYEKIDKSILNTAIRETREEIGFSLLTEYNNISSRLVCQNTFLDSSLGSKYLVYSSIFIIFDLFDEIDQNIKASEREVANVIFTPIDYLYDIKNSKNSNIIHEDFQSPFDKRKKLKIEKLILNKNENFILFGMTLRILCKVINYSHKHIYECSLVNDQANALEKIGNKMLSSINLLFDPRLSYNIMKLV